MSEKHPVETMMDMLNGYMVSQCVYVAAKLGIADRLDGGPMTVTALASDCGAHAESLHRVMRLLASHGVFAETEPGTFALTPAAELLRTDAPRSIRDWAIYRGEPFMWRSWGNILYSVKTGEPAFFDEFGCEWHEHLSNEPEVSAIYDGAMHAVSRQKFRAVAKAYDFSNVKTVADVGGGNGGLIASVLESNPSLLGMLCDRPYVVDKAGPHLEAAGVSDRCTIHGIDMFECVPAGGDVYMLSNVIHDWDDEKCIEILSNCQAVLPPEGRILLIEIVIPPGNDRHAGKLMDIEMLVFTRGGKERTEQEYAALFQAAGLLLDRVILTKSPFCILEGKHAN